MTRKDREVIQTVYAIVSHIVDWDNKNLKQLQFYDLTRARDYLRALLIEGRTQ